jgi:hypothetical protein
MKQLRTLEMDTSIHKNGEEDVSSSSEAESAMKQAQELLQTELRTGDLVDILQVD